MLSIKIILPHEQTKKSTALGHMMVDAMTISGLYGP